MNDTENKESKKEKNVLKKWHGLVIPFIIVLAFGAQLVFIYFYEKCLPGVVIKNTDSILSSFYSTLFTIIAVIVGVAALIGWRSIKDDFDRKIEETTEKAGKIEKNWNEHKDELEKKTNEMAEKLKQFNEIKDEVNYLSQRKKWAEWAREKFDSEDSSITSSKIKYTKEEKKKVKEIEDRLLNDFIEVSWLEVIYAKELIDKDKIDQLDDEQIIIRRFKSAYRILDFILLRGMSDNCSLQNNHNSKLEGKVYHFLGQLVWEYYSKMKERFCNKNGLSKDSYNKWKDESVNDLRKEGKFTLEECLKFSKEYYEKAKNIKEKKGEKTYETIGNLAIVLIEFAKLNINADDLEKAKEYLEKVEKSDEVTFNTNWDLARYYYYKDKEKNTKDIRDYLFKAVDGIEKPKHKGVFINGIRDEYKETEFPGDEELIKELRNKLYQINHLK